MQVHLVDGTYELFRCFHGAPRATTRTGREVGGTRGLLATFVALLNDPSVTHVAVAFDAVVAPAGTERMKAAEAALAGQIGLAAEVVRALGVELWPSGRFQADELLSTAALRFAQDDRVDQVVICTTDLDLAQCVRADRVVLLDRSRKRITTEAGIAARFGVRAQLLPDLFALVGDRSDGIAGVPGWGVRTAAALLNEFGSVDAIPVDPSRWNTRVRGADRLAAALRARRREALIARDVLHLREDVPLPVTLDELEWRGAHRGPLAALAREIEYEDPLDWITSWATA